jgi:hypothetical protein
MEAVFKAKPGAENLLRLMAELCNSGVQCVLVCGPNTGLSVGTVDGWGNWIAYNNVYGPHTEIDSNWLAKEGYQRMADELHDNVLRFMPSTDYSRARIKSE